MMSVVGRIGNRVNSIATHANPMRWTRARADSPVATISFDDFPKSAWTLGGEILARYGVRATYYVSGRYCGTTENGTQYYVYDDLGAIVRAGHEIGAHSYAHTRAPGVGSDNLLSDMERNAAFLSGVEGLTGVCSYAYPYGAVSPRTKALFAHRFASARGISRGVNAGWLDLAELKAVPLEHCRWVPEEIDSLVEATVRSKGWLILFTHDVAEDPSPFGCTPDMLSYTLDAIAAANIRVLPTKHAMARMVFGDGS